MFTQPPMWEWTPKPNNYTTPLPTTMQIPTRAEHRALFAQALQQVAGHPGIRETDACAIRAAVEVVLPDLTCPEPDRHRLASATRWWERRRHRAQFLALADAIEGGD